MIYKFMSSDDFIEVTQSDKNEVSIRIAEGKKESIIYLNSGDVYNLIGALHTLKAKISK